MLCNLYKRIYKPILKYNLMETQKKLFTYEHKKFDLREQITFTEKEKKIFEVIKKVVEKYGLQKVECRVAGGWVRDKVNRL